MKKFTESLGLAVFTTRYVIEQGAPILYVYHCNDGSWQFNGEESSLTDEDYRVISLGEVLAIDDTLNELINMPLGFEALRKTKNDKWEIVSSN